MVTSLTQTNYYCNNSFTTYVFALAHFGLQNAVFCFHYQKFMYICLSIHHLFIIYLHCCQFLLKKARSDLGVSIG